MVPSSCAIPSTSTLVGICTVVRATTVPYTDATIRDYFEWHADYDVPGSRLHLRLLVVQDFIAQAVDSGARRIISMCAGQGRDVITVAARHRHGRDLTGYLVELNAANVEAATRAAVELAGFRVVHADAGVSDVYEPAAPADLVVACGIFGNISDGDIERTVAFLPSLCAPGAWVVWTRHPRPDGVIERIERLFADAGFANEPSVVVEDGFGVGAARLVDAPRPFERGVRLFEFIH